MREYKTVGDAVRDYVARRDKLREWTKEVAEQEAIKKAELEEIEVHLLGIADKMGVDSFKTPYGTAYKSYTERYRIGDWGKFVAYVKEHDAFNLFEKRVAKLAAKEIHTETGEIPPGLDYSKEAGMNILRPGKKD
jgi:hypothetical protein